MKIAIYTAQSGMETELRDPPVIHKDVDYIAFTDKNITSKVWQVRPVIQFSNIDSDYVSRRDAKIYKILPNLFLPEYDLTVWHDSSCYCLAHPSEIAKNHMINEDLAVFYHRWRNCVYEEAQEVIRLNRDSADKVESQVNYYKSKSYPEKNGLYELPVIFRKNSESNSVMNLRWWEHICKFSSRDQISFPFVLWSMNKKPVVLAGRANTRSNNIAPRYPRYRR